MANSSDSDTFSVQLVLPINDVQDKIKQKASVKSINFLCKDDPTPIEFQLEAKFDMENGSESSPHLWVQLKAKYKHASMKAAQITIVDHSGHQIVMKKFKKDSKSYVLESTWGYFPLFPLWLLSESKIVILCLLEYLPWQNNPVTLDEYSAEMRKDFLDMLDSATYADVEFLVQNEMIPAHKSILAARSIYFKNMFEAGMQESASNQVTVTDVEPATFKAVLKYLYGHIPKNEEYASLAKLMVAADKYGLDDLKEQCDDAICANLQVENVIDCLLLADTYNFSNVFSDAETLFKAHVETLGQNEENWSKLAQRPSLLLRMLKSFAKYPLLT